MFKTRVVNIGNLPLGGDHPIRLQSMTNTSTLDTESTVEQAIRIINAGADYVRISTPSLKDAENLVNIRKRMHQLGYDNPIIADIHFNPKVAEHAAKIADKIRINPGNLISRKSVLTGSLSDKEYVRELDLVREKFVPIIKICKSYNTAIRIGVNHGSLSERILFRYGDTPEGMVESAIEYLEICREMDFHNVVVSMKSSNTKFMIYASRLLVKRMIDEEMHYPQHLGVTEAGEGEDGRIRSAVGIGTLLSEGIGDTIRVSLTEEPENEIPVAKTILSNINGGVRLFNSQKNLRALSTAFGSRSVYKPDSINNKPNPVVVGNDIMDSDLMRDISFVYNGQKISTKVVEDVGEGIVLFEDGTFSEFIKALEENKKMNPVVIKKRVAGDETEKFQIISALETGKYFIDMCCEGLWIESTEGINQKTITRTALGILQATGSRYSKPEYISCPTCSRTSFDIQKAVQEIKERTKGKEGIKIAVMGCIVNGPGEMADADFGYVGSGKGLVTLYKGRHIIEKNVPETEAVDRLIAIIERKT